MNAFYDSITQVFGEIAATYEGVDFEFVVNEGSRDKTLVALIVFLGGV